MSFELRWTQTAAETFAELEAAARTSLDTRRRTGKSKGSRQEGLFKQVVKCIDLLRTNPRHPGLQTHEFSSLPHPSDKNEKVFEAYVQNRTPNAYRVFWCYGPKRGEITIVAITSHP